MTTYAEVVESLPYVLSEEVEKAAKLASQWAKPHRCGREGRVVLISREEWESWPLYSLGGDEFAEYEYKNCPECSSTLLVLTKIYSMEME